MILPVEVTLQTEDVLEVDVKNIGTPTSKQDPERPAYQNNLGLRPSDKYIRTGNIQHLNRAISGIKEAIDATPKDHPNRAKWIMNRVVYLSERDIHDKMIQDESNSYSIQPPEWLWKYIVHPVLKDLGFTTPSPNPQLFRLWWEPTGRLTRFQLHAAGIHGLNYKIKTVLNMIVSSYASSVKAIIHSRRQQQRRNLLTDADLLSRLMSRGPQCPEAKGIAEKSAAAAERGRAIHLKGLPDLSFCRARLHRQNRSAAELAAAYDWNTAPLTVQSLLDVGLDTAMSFLAYLSACGTTRNYAARKLRQKWLDGGNIPDKDSIFRAALIEDNTVPAL
ncbi:hypothetical protein F4814DRAFT_457581 [Daldinia grandis]|nr:hypothetical protein F4814DRAFT_457581 [Daldinia grandis]